MLRLALPLLVGILCATQFSIPYIYALLLILISAAFFVRLRVRLLIYPLILGFGALLGSLRGTSGELTSSLVTIKVEDRQMGRVVSEYSEQDEQWHRCNHKVLLRGFDSLSYSTIVARVSVTTLGRKNSSSYYKMLYNQDVRHIAKLVEVVAQGEESPPLSVRMNRWATTRLESLSLSDEAFALTAAMSLARRELLDEQTVARYRRSGTSHIMALSGMHMGIVLLLAWWLFLPFAVVNRGHLVSSLLAIVAIWMFAFVAGLGDSILRAAWMFTLLQLALVFSKRYGSLNSLCTTLIIMLCCDPFAVYDLGFQLSFLSVATIITIGGPIVSKARTHIWLLDVVVNSLIISCIATITVTPLVSHYFGYVALLSPFATLLLLPTLTVIIALALLWILCPLAALAPLFRVAIESAVIIQDYIAEWFASISWGGFDLKISTLAMALSYLLLSLLMVGYQALRQKRRRYPTSWKRF